MLRGSCLCGTVRYEISGALYTSSHCHCGQCRKGHGAAFASYANVDACDFRFVSGADAVATYRASTSARRTFCRHCGSNLQWCADATPERFAVALGTLDDDPQIEVKRHIFVAFKVPWYLLNDGLPQHADGGPDGY